MRALRKGQAGMFAFRDGIVGAARRRACLRCRTVRSDEAMTLLQNHFAIAKS